MRLLLLAFLFPFALYAQVPQAFEFQGIARDVSGNVLVSGSIGLRLSIISGSPQGTLEYQESQSTTTSPFGLFTVQIGSGTVVSGSFSSIAWAVGAHYLKVEFDPLGGNNFQDLGTTQLLSVPYALVSGTNTNCFTVSLIGDTLHQGNGCFVIIPGISAANGGCADGDQDGFYDQAGCGTPIDCDDNNSSIAPDLIFYQDLDGDGFGTGAQSVQGCVPPPGFTAQNGDCDDSDPQVFPGQDCSEFCDQADQAWLDQNMEDYIIMVSESFISCGFPTTQQGMLCIIEYLEDQSIPISPQCHTCGIGTVSCILQSCAGQCVNDPAACFNCATEAGCLAAFTECAGLPDVDGDGWSTGSDCDDNDATVHAYADELCDGKDNDCDGQVDEGVNTQTDPQNCGACGVVCPSGFGCVNGQCAQCVDDDQDGFTICDGDCSDADITINPGAQEICDGIDNNCDGNVDENIDLQTDPQNCSACGMVCPQGMSCVNGICQACPDADQDGYTTCDGDCDDSDPNFNPDAFDDCNGNDNNCDGVIANTLDQDGDGISSCQGDCDDTNPSISPQAIEQCDGLDNNCNGQVDEGFATITCGTGACQVSIPACANGQMQICVPNSPSIEVCDGIDNDCDGSVDEGGVCSSTCTDGILNGQETGVDCGGPSCPPCQQCLDNDADGFTTCNGDCNDSNFNIRPGAQETCNGIDDDCDGQIDEGLGTITCGTGACQNTVPACLNGVPQTCTINPASTEICDGIDNDCDGSVDEGNPGGGGTCNTGMPGVCAQGVVTCSNGMLIC